MDKLLDGKGLSQQIKNEIKIEINKLKQDKGIIPGLAVILVGDDPASDLYVNIKEKACKEVGIYSKVHRLDKNTSEDDIISLIDNLNKDEKIHGILVQLPLPKGIDEKVVNESIYPSKDVDGFTPLNLGKLFTNRPSFIPCTPKGILRLLKHFKIELEGKNVVVIGRSDIVGKPLATLLLNENATITQCHSKSKDIALYTKEADIICIAIGRPNSINRGMIKKDAIIIDIGTNKINDKLVGDVDFESVLSKVSKITPVPGGIGPMTIAMLLENTLEAALDENQNI